MKKILFLLVAVILVAGCIGQRPVRLDANRGVTINLFTASPTSTKSGNPVLFELEIENVGGTTAKGVTAELFGVESQWRLASAGNAVVPDTRLEGPFARLRPPSLDKDLPGDFKIIQWELVTPEVPQGVAPEFPVTARVQYDYNTSGFLRILSISNEELKKREILNQPVGDPVEFLNSQGPIKISIGERNRQPIVVDLDDPEPYEYFPMRIEVTNVGDGFPITGNDFGRFTGTIELRGAGATFDTCLGQTGGTFIDLNDAEIPTKLRETKTVALQCDVKIDKAQWGTRGFDTVTLEFNIFYRYFVDQTVTVKVFGK